MMKAFCFICFEYFESKKHDGGKWKPVKVYMEEDDAQKWKEKEEKENIRYYDKIPIEFHATKKTIKSAKDTFTNYSVDEIWKKLNK